MARSGILESQCAECRFQEAGFMSAAKSQACIHFACMCVCCAFDLKLGVPSLRMILNFDVFVSFWYLFFLPALDAKIRFDDPERLIFGLELDVFESHPTFEQFSPQTAQTESWGDLHFLNAR